MPRVDVWDVAPDAESAAQEIIEAGFPRGLDAKYTLGRQLGSGGFGVVRLATSISTGTEYACKSIKKRLDLTNAAPVKQMQHLDNVRREATILRRLRGTLNVVHLEDVFEDDVYVHLVMEYCRGGELLHRIGQRHYSERTVASYMRAVLRTLAQCHHHRILHRDIKPGNFMLLTEADDAPLKALDFGLAVFYDPQKLPRTDLGLEGTPWFMAPEALSSAVVPESDVWSAGVMAYQLLSGQFPFDDWKNKKAPALSLVWKSILTEEPKFASSYWKDISSEAQDFVKSLLVKDPKKRPSARAALAHPWLLGRARERMQGRPLERTVVQRLQSFGTQNIFKRTILDMIANELLNRHMEAAAAAAAPARSGPEPVVEEAKEDAAQVEGSRHQPQKLRSALTAAIGSSLQRPAEQNGTADSGSSGMHQVMHNPKARQLAARELLRSLAARGSQTVHSGSQAYANMQRSATLAIPDRKGAKEGAAAHSLGGSVGVSNGLLGASLGCNPSISRGAAAAAALASGAFVSAASLPRNQASGGSSAGPSEARGIPFKRSSSSQQFSVAGSAPGYHGPVRDPAAATNWDLQYMANRRQTHEGSGHALQQYAWLLGVGERSLHGAKEAAHTLSIHGQSTAGQLLGVDLPAAGASSGASGRVSSPGSARAAVAATTAAAASGLHKRPDGSSRGGDDFLQLLDAVQRQRLEHRKIQRLILDTSGHGQSGYASQLHNVQNDVPEEDMREESGEEDESDADNSSTVLDTPDSVSQDGSDSPAANRRGDQAEGSAPTGRQGSLMKHVGNAFRGIFARAGDKDNDSKGSSSSGAGDTRAPRSRSLHAAQLETSRQSSVSADVDEFGKRGRGHGGYAALMGLGGAAGSNGEEEKGSGGSVISSALPPAAEGGGRGTKSALMAIRTVRAHRPSIDIERPSMDAMPVIMPAPAKVATPQKGRLAQQLLRVTQRETRTRESEAWKQATVQEQEQMQPSGEASGESAAPPSTFAGSLAQPVPGSTTSADGDGGRSAKANALRVSFSGGGNVFESRPAAISPAKDAEVVADTPAPGGHDLITTLSSFISSPEELTAARDVLAKLKYDENSELTYSQVSEGLKCLGYQLTTQEVKDLLDEVGGSGKVTQSQFIASQVDWREFQANHREEWLSCLRSTFEGLDTNKDGVVSTNDLVNLLLTKLPEDEVNFAVQETLMDAAVDADGLDFDAFVGLLRSNSVDSLSGLDPFELYDPRTTFYDKSVHSGGELDALMTGVGLQHPLSGRLETVMDGEEK